MKDEECVRFLQWALPRLGMRWPGFRKVRKQVCKRFGRRLRALDLEDIDAYQAYLSTHAEEWEHLDSMCRITISRFFRDKGVFVSLTREVLPTLAQTAHERDADALRCWSAGCGSGEEPYTLKALWAIELQPAFPDIMIEIVATDIDAGLLQRARNARYAFGSVKEMPERWRDRIFTHERDEYRLKPEYAHDIVFLEQDIRAEQPKGPFDLVLCRNLVFTYFDEEIQERLLNRMVGAMCDGAALVLGVHERLPDDMQGLSVWFDKQRIYRLST